MPTCCSGAADGAKTTGILTGKLAEGGPREKLWSVPLLYRNQANPYLQELTFQGQLQLQYAYGSDDAGQYGSGENLS